MDLITLFKKAHENTLRSKTVPEILLSFYPFVNLSHTVRLRKGKIHVRLSDICQDAPIPVLEAIAHILLAKLYKRKIDKKYVHLYRTYTNGENVKKKVRAIRKKRSRKFDGQSIGQIYNLKEIFDKLNRQYFDGKLNVDHIAWSKNPSVRCLGFYDGLHNRIVISKSLDKRPTPTFFLEYIVYHEMLHMVHPSHVNNGRRRFHHEEFREDEMRFPFYLQAKMFLKRNYNF